MSTAVALLGIVGLVALVVVQRATVSRLERLGLTLFVLVGLCVGGGGILSQWVPDVSLLADGRALMACALGPFLALVWRPVSIPSRASAWDPSTRAAGLGLGVVATLLVALGLAGQVTSLLQADVGSAIVAAALGISTVVAAAATYALFRLRRLTKGALAWGRASHEVAAAALYGIACAMGALGALSALFGGSGDVVVAFSSAWAGPLAGSIALAATGRLAPAPLQWRDTTAALLTTALLFLLLPLAAAAVAASTVVSVLALSSLIPRSLPRRFASVSPVEREPPAIAAGIAGVAPLLDTDRLRRPGRPRVLARTSARRILDAAIDRAWRAQPLHHGQRRPPIDLSTSDDADVDGDPGEIAEALCAVLDNAFRHQRIQGEGVIDVALRSASHTVSFEVAEGGPHGPLPPPFHVAGDLDGAHPGLGVGLSRARVLVERHGGQLHIQGEGGRVQITLPRRTNRGFVGLA